MTSSSPDSRVAVESQAEVEESQTGDREGPAPGEPGRTRGQRRVTIELWVILVLLGLGTATRWIDSPVPRPLPALQALGAASVPPVILAVGAAWSRRWRLTAAAAALALVQFALIVPTWLPGTRPADGVAGDRIVVMASNLHYGRGDLDTVVETVDELGVDVLVLLEATPEALSGLRAAGIEQRLRHAVARPREWAAGTAIFSRHPLRDTDVPAAPQTIFENPAVRAATPLGDIVMLAAHPVPPWPGNSALWHAELGAIASWAESVPAEAPLVLAGDFNATAAHPAFRRFGDLGLRDAHREAGSGPVTTWPRFPLPVLALLPAWFHIDHVLARGLAVTDAGVVRIPGSDHHAVWAELTGPAG